MLIQAREGGTTGSDGEGEPAPVGKLYVRIFRASVLSLLGGQRGSESLSPEIKTAPVTACIWRSGLLLEGKKQSKDRKVEKRKKNQTRGIWKTVLSF